MLSLFSVNHKAGLVVMGVGAKHVVTWNHLGGSKEVFSRLVLRV